MTRNGKTYHLLMGDAHRHTDIRGHSGVDGSVLDTYRYAMDAAQLDWLGTSDHNMSPATGPTACATTSGGTCRRPWT